VRNPHATEDEDYKENPWLETLPVWNLVSNEEKKRINFVIANDGVFLLNP